MPGEGADQDKADGQQAAPDEAAQETAPGQARPADAGWRASWRRLSTTAKAVTAVVVGAGAVASALTAIGALLPDDPPPVSVRFERPVHLSAVPVPMTQFRPRGGGVPSPAPRAAWWALDPTPSPVDPGASPSDAASETVTVSPSPSELPSEATSPSVTEQSPPARGSFPELEARRADEITSEVSDAGWVLEPPGPAPPAAQQLTSLFVTQNATGPQGNPLSAEAAAQQIVRKFEATRSWPTERGQVPVGVVVTAAIRVQNFAGEEVRIDWAMENANSNDARLSQQWLVGAPAATVTAETNDDRGVLELWVPLPRAPGTYVVKVTASRSQDSLPDDFVTTRPFQ